MRIMNRSNYSMYLRRSQNSMESDRSSSKTRVRSPENSKSREKSPSRTKQIIRDRSSETRRSKDEFEQRGRTPERKPVGEDSAIMRQLMGFDTFDTTKGRHVEGTDASGVKKKKKAKFRQYMNREKGFNRPLSPEGKKKKSKRDNK